jgi:hypothetical protein
MFLLDFDLRNLSNFRGNHVNHLFLQRRSVFRACVKLHRAIAFFVAAASSFSLHAATITVNSLLDPGSPATCTLRQAIESANTDTAIGACVAGLDVDTIVFDAALNLTAATPGTITLDQTSMSEAPFAPSAPVNWLLFAKGDLTIVGPGSAALTINGGGLSPSAVGKRILRVTDNDSLNARSISISGVSFKYGRNAIVASSITGGCVSSNESITLNDVVFEGCEVFSLGGNTGGGALFVGIPLSTTGVVSLPNVSLTNVTFLRNRAINAGSTATNFDIGGAAILGDAVVRVGTVSIVGSRFVGNSASSQGAMRIGNASSVNISQTRFASNAAVGSIGSSGRQGAFQIDTVAGNVTLSEAEVNGNSANRERGGAAIFTVGGTISITDSAFNGNQAPNGRIGGLEISTDTFNATTGACNNAQKNAVTLTRVSINGNRALTNTGGTRIFCSGNLSIVDSEIVGNVVSGSAVAGSGGNSAGTIFTNTSLAMTNVLIAQNETYAGAVDGGFGVFQVRDNDSFTGTRLIVRNNYASENESGISLVPGASSRLHEINNSTFYENRAKSIMALLLNNAGDYTVRNSTFAANKSITSGGSVVSINPNSTGATINATLENLTIARNGGNDSSLGVGTFGSGTPNASINIKNTILGQYQFGTGAPPVINAIAGVSYNIVNSLIENNFGVPSGICGANNVLCNVDAKLESVNDNGGSTATLALRAGSPALDAGASVSTTTDQRGVGFARVVGSAVDIGAFESPALTAALPCKLDMDGDNQVIATKEGLVLVRAMLGITGGSVVANSGISQTQWDSSRNNLNVNCGTNFAP